jgi:hypothetical protein
MYLFGTSLVLVVLLAQEEKPSPKFPLGKETTYITEPLDKDGYLDYEAALNDRLGKGITPEKNANTLIWKVIGPRTEGYEMPAEFFKRLGIEPPPEHGDYFIDLHRYMRHIKLEDEKHLEILEQQIRAEQRPWSAKDFPLLAAWLEGNAKPLALIVEASKRPQYFEPLVSRSTDKGQVLLITALRPTIFKCRELAGALAARAMLEVEESKFDDAWQDLLACHRLGRLVGQGATFIDCLVGIVINVKASKATLAYLDRAGLNAKQVQDRLKDLQSLPAMSPFADKIDFADRFVFLEAFQLFRRGEPSTLAFYTDADSFDNPAPEVLKALETVDWETALRNGNKWFDRIVAALRLKDRTEREKEFDKIAAEAEAMAKELEARGGFAKILLSNNTPKARGKAMGDLLLFGLFLHVSATRNLQNHFNRSEQLSRNLRVAFALAAYKSDNGRYPAKLDDLAPRYLEAVPDDLFSGKPLIYRPAEKGYLFYSVGINGKDENGRGTDDDPVGDDIGVRMPLPEPKPKP